MTKPLKIAVFAAALLGTGAVLGDAAPAVATLDPIVTGTAHDALFGIAFDGQSGVAVGGGGAIDQSTDGGKTWTPATSPTPLALLAVSLRGSHRIAVGQTGMAVISDTGAKWDKIDTGSTERLLGVSVNTNGLAVAVGSFGTVLKSEDAGKTWKSIAPPTWDNFVTAANAGVQPHMYDTRVEDNGTITIAGEFSIILKSTDGGATWRAVHKGDASIFALDLRPDGIGYAVGQSGSILKTSDHGETWQDVSSGSQAILLGVKASADGSKVFVTGMHDMVVSTDGGKSFQHVGGTEVAASWYEGASAADGAADVLAVGHGGRIVRLSAGG